MDILLGLRVFICLVQCADIVSIISDLMLKVQDLLVETQTVDLGLFDPLLQHKVQSVVVLHLALDVKTVLVGGKERRHVRIQAIKVIDYFAAADD